MTRSNNSRKRHILAYFYGLYVWLEFIPIAACMTVVALVVPGLERRRRYVALLGRLSLRLAGIKTEVVGLENLPVQDCVVVANHASYVDAVVLQGFLPARFSFVVKGEMEKFPVIGFLLRRVGCRFVERFNANGSARDARRLLRAATAGESLAIFPEGTFSPEPGLRDFRAGAFAAAIRSGTPIVPLVISGSRQILVAETLLPRHGHLRIDVLPAIDASHPAYAKSKDLAAQARQQILAVLDEPDLAQASVASESSA